MEKFDKDIKYILLKGDKETWTDLENGKRLYFYFNEDLGQPIRAFFYNPEDHGLYGQINFEEGLSLSYDAMEDFSEKYDYGNFSKEGKGAKEVYALAVGSIIKIKTLYIEEMEDFSDFLSLDLAEAQNFLKLIEENFLGQEDFEQEVKFLLGQEEFEKIYGNFVEEKNPIKQVNYYFDPSEFLGDKSTTIRIREKKGKYTLTVKEKKSDEKDLSTEKSAPISVDDFERIMAAGFVNIRDYIPDSLIGEVPFLASLETIRDEVTYKNIYLAFDISSYFGKVDYEIEMEGRQNHIDELIKKLALENKAFNEESKFARFIREYENRK